jgi:hypothetical protein
MVVAAATLVDAIDALVEKRDRRTIRAASPAGTGGRPPIVVPPEHAMQHDKRDAPPPESPAPIWFAIVHVRPHWTAGYIQAAGFRQAPRRISALLPAPAGQLSNGSFSRCGPTKGNPITHRGASFRFTVVRCVAGVGWRRAGGARRKRAPALIRRAGVRRAGERSCPDCVQNTGALPWVPARRSITVLPDQPVRDVLAAYLRLSADFMYTVDPA